jgi:hypothetical protein
MCIDVDSPLSNKLLHLTPRQHDSQVTSLRRRLDASRSAQVNSNVMRLNSVKQQTCILGIGVVCLLAFSSIRPQTSQTDGSYEAAIASLAENSDAQLVSKAIATLKSAGTKAFPALLAHLNDATTASEAFQHEVQDINGNVPRPTIGEACFDLIQHQVEGNWPKALRQHYALSPSNVVSWLGARKGKSLNQLRIEAAQTSLTRARQRRGTSAYSRDAVRFLEKHLREVRADKND